MSLLKGILGVKRSAPSWTALRECAQEPLHLDSIRTVKLYYAITDSISIYRYIVYDPFLKNILRDVQLSCTDCTNWSAGLMSAFGGLSRGQTLHRQLETYRLLS